MTNKIISGIALAMIIVVLFVWLGGMLRVTNCFCSMLSQSMGQYDRLGFAFTYRDGVISVNRAEVWMLRAHCQCQIPLLLGPDEWKLPW